LKKSGIALVLTGALIGIGVILSFYGNYVIFEDLAQTNGEVSLNNDLILEVDLDNSKYKTGIFAVQIIDFKDQTISVNIIDPLESTIESKTISEESYEGTFDLQISGTYKMVVSNNGNGVNVFGVIGPEPDDVKRTLAFVSLYLLVFGLIGMVMVGALIVFNRKRTIN
jgi:hypothetical protein